MSAPITEKEFPIQKNWLYKKVFTILLSMMFLGVFFTPFILLTPETRRERELAHDFVLYTFLTLLFITVLVSVIVILKRKTFHYSIEEKFLVGEQGIIARQKKYLPYGRIQHIIIKRDLIDKMLGLSSLAIENAAQGGSQVNNNRYAMMGGLAGMAARKSMQQVEIIGFNGNKMGIPGLKQEDAKKVEEVLIEKILSHLNEEDKGSGL